jgi:hypothetical protein
MSTHPARAPHLAAGRVGGQIMSLTITEPHRRLEGAGAGGEAATRTTRSITAPVPAGPAA